MQEKSRSIFGNPMTGRVYRKAVNSKKKYSKKFGDDTGVSYPVSLQKNSHIGDLLGVVDVLLSRKTRLSDRHRQKESRMH